VQAVEARTSDLDEVPCLLSGGVDSSTVAAVAAKILGKKVRTYSLVFEDEELSEAKYEEWAKQIGLDVARWSKDKESPEVAALIAKDNAYGQQVGAEGTPSFFINGHRHLGAYDIETLKRAVDAARAQATAPAR